MIKNRIDNANSLERVSSKTLSLYYTAYISINTTQHTNTHTLSIEPSSPKRLKLMIPVTPGKTPTKEQLKLCAPSYANKILKVLFSREQLENRISELAKTISNDLKGESVLVVGLLKGAFIAVADVARHLTVPNKIDFMVASSYGHGTETTGVIKLKKDLDVDPSGKHILIVEDLIDTGTTLEWIKKYLLTKEPKSVRICCILDKKARRTSSVKVDYVGFECPDEFVVGYGMDFAGDFRTLPFVGVLKPSAYKSTAESDVVSAKGSPRSPHKS
jgi:hypoxanthine phosphoribosyltransferase